MRTSKAVAVLDKREAALREDLRTLQAQIEAVQTTLLTVSTLRKEMAALPKRPSRSKPRGAIVSAKGNAETTATTATAA